MEREISTQGQSGECEGRREVDYYKTIEALESKRIEPKRSCRSRRPRATRLGAVKTGAGKSLGYVMTAYNDAVSKLTYKDSDGVKKGGHHALDHIRDSSWFGGAGTTNRYHDGGVSFMRRWSSPSS